jgi:hypothetical protein
VTYTKPVSSGSPASSGSLPSFSLVGSDASSTAAPVAESSSAPAGYPVASSTAAAEATPSAEAPGYGYKRGLKLW